LDQLTVRKS
jgi:hypothetical protein